MGLFFYAIETFHDRQHFFLFSRLLLVIALVVGLYGIAQKFFGREILIPYITYASGGKDISKIDDFLLQARVLSSYGDPNVLACQLLLFEGIALALLVGKGLSLGTRLGGVMILSTTILCVFFTGSRAGMVCLFLVPVVVLYWRTRWSLLILPGLAALGFIFLPSLGELALLSQVGELGPKMNLDPTDLRAQFPALAWKLLQAVPFGCGWGRTVELEVMGLNWHFMLIPAEVIWMGFNSFWLNLFSRLGIPGVITFGLFLMMVFRYIWRQAKRVRNRWVQAFLIGGLAGFTGQWVIWVVNNTYMLPGGGLNFWFMLGMLAAGSRAFAEPRYPICWVYPPPGAEPGRGAYMNYTPDDYLKSP
ncbi:MAG: hypothetical protein AMJ79_10495 [Phycisphaerae bacterium SM23_30]|nr:MAG: hypothetical protein AMJ79_10495 [Phycisphaerae bacterium SM23_30]